MNVSETITEVLQKIPAGLRFGLLAVFAGTVVFTQVLEGFGVGLHEGVYRALVLIGGYLGVQSAANVDLKPKK